MEEQKQFFSALRIVRNRDFHTFRHDHDQSHRSMEKISKHLVNYSIHDVVWSILKHKNGPLVRYVVFIIVRFELCRNYVHLQKVCIVR